MLGNVSEYTTYSHSWREFDPVSKMPILCFLRGKKQAKLKFEVRIPALDSDTLANPLQVFQMLSIKFFSSLHSICPQI